MAARIDSCKVASDPRHLRYLAENFGALQGLNSVALGTIFFLEGASDVYGAPRWWWLCATGIAVIAAFRYIPRYYQRRFGYVEPRNPTNKQAALFALVLILLLVFGRYFARRADPVISELEHGPHLLISDPTQQVKLYPLMLWIVALCAGFRKHVRSVDPYEIYFLVYGTIASAVIVIYPIWYPEAKQMMLWRTLNACSFGISLIALGLYNHLKLVRLLPNVRAEIDLEK